MENQAARPLPPEEIALFCEQVSMALSAGIPLHDAMETLYRANGDGPYAEQFREMYESVLKTGQLNRAVRGVGMFPTYLCGMIAIGERAGRLDDVTRQLASYYRWEAEVRAGVRNAILYPAVLVLMLAVVIAILVVSVLPVFEGVYATLGMPVSGAEGALLRIGAGIGKGALVVIGLILAAGVVIGVLLKTKRRQSVRAWLCRWLRPVRRASESLSAARFASVCQLMLVSGCSLDAAMELAQTVITDAAYGARVRTAAARMKEGEPFHDVVTQEGLFQGIYAQLIKFGAVAGQLDIVMAELAETYQKEADESIGRLVSLIEPTLVAVLSVVIGGILLSVTLPLLSVLSAMG